jgi:hypothetical protein
MDCLNDGLRCTTARVTSNDNQLRGNNSSQAERSHIARSKARQRGQHLVDVRLMLRILLVVTNKSKHALYGKHEPKHTNWATGRARLAAEVTFLHTRTGGFHVLRAVIALREFGRVGRWRGAQPTQHAHAEQ